MYFNLPVRLYEDAGCVMKHAEEMASFGSKALIVTGAHSSKLNGSLEDVQLALEKYNVEWSVFDQVEPNPSVETVMKGRDAGVSFGADFVVGVGGGSSLDAAKSIALMIAHPDRDIPFLLNDIAHNQGLPTVMVPTTCGTGSEVTAVSVLTSQGGKKKGSTPHRTFPKLALLDPIYLAYAPDQVLRSTAADAFCHLVESALNKTADDFSRIFALQGMRVWSRAEDVLAGNFKPNPEDLEDLMNASSIAGMAIAHTGTSIPHALSYRLTLDLGIPHGTACAYFLPGYMAECPGKDLDELLDAAGFASVAEVKEFLTEMLGEIPVPEETLLAAVDEVAMKPGKLALAPFVCDRSVLLKIAGLA